MSTITTVDGAWVRPDVAEYAEWLRDTRGDRTYFLIGMIEGIHRGRQTAEEKCAKTAVALAAFDVVQAEQREARP